MPSKPATSRKPRKAPETLREWAQGVTLEKSVEAEMRTLAEHNGWRVHKIDVMRGVKVKYPNGRGERNFTEGTTGQADLIMVRPRLARTGCQMAGRIFTPENFFLPMDVIYVEAKRPKRGVYSPEQQAWAAVTERDGFPVVCARSWAELVEKARAKGIEMERKV